MIITTTPLVEGHEISDYRGIVAGEAILSADRLSDNNRCEHLAEARKTALREMERRGEEAGGDAVVGVNLDCAFGQDWLVVSASGTAVTIR